MDLLANFPMPCAGTPLTYNKAFLEQTGLTYVRGCEVEGMLDQNGRVIEDGPEPKPELPGDTRTYRLLLDQNQYRIDMESLAAGNEVRDCSEVFRNLFKMELTDSSSFFLFFSNRSECVRNV